VFSRAKLRNKTGRTTKSRGIFMPPLARMIQQKKMPGFSDIFRAIIFCDYLRPPPKTTPSESPK